MHLPKHLTIVATAGILPQLVAFATIPYQRTKYSVLVSTLISILAFAATKRLIPVLQRRTLKAGLYGKDINKKGTEAGEKPIPESLGLACGLVFLVVMVLSQQLHYYDVASLVEHLLHHGHGRMWQPELMSDAWLVDYNAALATICFMLFLGFADDVLDIPWRVKLQLPAIAALPLLIAYSGGTVIKVPRPIRELLSPQLEAWLGPLVAPLLQQQQPISIPEFFDMGILYKCYMIALTIFCTNSINILAGVNGLEAGQTFIIACAVSVLNMTELAGYAGGVASVREGHLFSLYLMLPLAATTLALLVFNWYPSQVFVGDTFTYFAGMTFAVAGILGHYSETLLLFFAPQVFNFMYSVPQLFKLVPCPRHRLPRFDPATGLLHATPNWNLVNLTLQVFGPATEEALCVRILGMQVVSCGAAFGIRYALAGVYKE